MIYRSIVVNALGFATRKQGCHTNCLRNPTEIQFSLRLAPYLCEEMSLPWTSVSYVALVCYCNTIWGTW